MVRLFLDKIGKIITKNMILTDEDYEVYIYVFEYIFQNIIFWTSAKNNMKIGDVVQYDQNGKRHSVIITQKSGSVVRYCAHTSNRKNENINTFYNYMVNNGITNFYVISFS